jgi:hypothetical protein
MGQVLKIFAYQLKSRQLFSISNNAVTPTFRFCEYATATFCIQSTVFVFDRQTAKSRSPGRLRLFMPYGSNQASWNG